MVAIPTFAAALATVNSVLARPGPCEQPSASVAMWSHGSAESMQLRLLFRPVSTLARVGLQTPAPE